MAQLLKHLSEDVDDQAQALCGWRQRYEQLGCGRFRGTAWQLVMNHGALLRESTNRSLREQIQPPPDHLVLAIPVTVAPGSVLAGRPLGRESLVVISGQDECELVAAGALDIIALSVHRDTLTQSLAASKIEWLARAERRQHLTLAPDAASAIRTMLLAVSDEALRRVDERVDEVDEARLISATLTQAVVLAMSGDGAERREDIPRRAETRMRVVRRAIEFMRENLHNDVGVMEICAAAFASRRSLQYCFEEFLHTSPQACLRALRLNEARRHLKRHGDRPITALASSLGFSSASHFTRHYKLMFGELPSQTLRTHAHAQTQGSAPALATGAALQA
jgi:AraC family ethanolamine operon transcriptional activator